MDENVSPQVEVESGETVSLELGFVCPQGCPNKGKSPTVLIKQQDEDFRSRSRNAVVMAFAIIVMGWSANIWISKKPPTFMEYALSSIGLALLIVAPVEAKDLSIGILKSAVEKMGGSSKPANITLTVNHSPTPPTERS